MNDGLLTPDQLRGWITNRFYYQQQIPVKDSIILSKLPTREDRRHWLTRIIDQDGRRGEEGGIEAWLRLGEAAGIARTRLLSEDAVVPAARAAVDSYVAFCRERPWLEGVAASLTELFAPDLMAARVAALERHYAWLRPEGLEYFRRRLQQAPRDADHALRLVVGHAERRAQQQKAVAALNFKCDVLWALLDAIDAGYPEREVR